MNDRIAVIGLGYVGLPVALAFARKFPDTVGFDIDCGQIDELDAGTTATERSRRPSSIARRDHVRPAELEAPPSSSSPCPRRSTEQRPRPHAAREGLRVRRQELIKGAIVVYESTVYPGATEEVCGPILEKVSGLVQGSDFKLGYSPERINPGDTEHTLETIMKVVSGEDAETLERVAAVYGAHRHGRRPPGAVDQGRRGGQGHREHAARPQHRAHERARGHLRPPRHPHHRRARGRRHEVELPPVPPRPRRRSLHRRRPLLPDRRRRSRSATSPRSSSPAAASTTTSRRSSRRR